MRNLFAASFHIVAFILALITLIPAVLFAYWAVDRTLPVYHIMGQFVMWESLDPPVVKVQWSGERRRLCLGQTTSWIFSDKAIDLPAAVLPHRDAVNSDGTGPVKWMESIPIPPEAFGHKEDAITLNVRFTWYCNPLQEYWPLEMDAPPIGLPIPDNMK